MARATFRRTYAGNAALRNLTSLFASLRSRRAQKSPDAVSEAALLAAVFGIYGVAGLDMTCPISSTPCSPGWQSIALSRSR